MINIVIPMAGLGSRFNRGGYEKPKPFIDVAGMPMIERVLENLRIPNANYILIVQKKHLLKEVDLIAYLKSKYNVLVVEIDGLTEGTACTTLFARNLVNNNVPLIIANSDQVVDFSAEEFFRDACHRDLDGSILTFIDYQKNPKWSFAKLDHNNLVIEVKEKTAISNCATVGIYYFKNGSDYVDSAIDMILNRDKCNGEYYTCPVYNYLILKNKKIGVYEVKADAMHGLGTPEDLEIYLNKIN